MQLTMKSLATAVQAVTKALHDTAAAADTATEKTKQALSAHEQHKKALQEGAPLIAGYFDTIDGLIKKMFESENVFEQMYIKRDLHFFAETIVRNLGGQAGVGFDINKYIDQFIEELKKKQKGGAPASGSVSNPPSPFGSSSGASGNFTSSSTTSGAVAGGRLP